MFIGIPWETVHIEETGASIEQESECPRENGGSLTKHN